MNFREYLEKVEKRPIVNHTSGTFIRNARADNGFPENFASWSELKSYLEGKGTDPEGLKAGQRVFRSYRDYTKKYVKQPAAALN